MYTSATSIQHVIAGNTTTSYVVCICRGLLTLPQYKSLLHTSAFLNVYYLL
jgi:hypothetical protein